MYGQTGAKTSSFFEMDIAASTTATGRKLLIYAKDMIESVYNNVNIDTKHGNMKINAEYIYGDSVANYTPIYVKIDGKFEIIQIDELGKKYGENNWKQCVEPGKQTKEYIESPTFYAFNSLIMLMFRNETLHFYIFFCHLLSI